MLVMVTLFTALILIFAEQRTLVSHGPAQVQIRVEIERNDLVVLNNEAEQVVEVTFEGAQGQMAQLKDRLSNHLPVVVHPSVDEAGVQSDALGDLLEGSELLAGLYVNIIELNPPAIEFEIDRLDELTATVRFEPEGVQLLDGSGQVDPAQIQITGPASTLERLVGYPENIELGLEPIEDIQSLEPGVEQRRSPLVLLPEGLADDPHVKLDPNAVEVTFTIEKLNTAAKLILPSVPVRMTMLPDDHKKYVVLIHEDDRVISQVEVTAPPELLEQLTENPLFADIDLSSDNLANAANSGEEYTTQAIPDIRIEGIEVEWPTTTIRYTVTRQP